MRVDRDVASGEIELLTLSACDIASGGQSDGREVDGLGMMAQRKGVKGVMASLWKVDDRSAGMLMADFYQRWMSTPKIAIADAPCLAQLDLLHGGLASRNPIVLFTILLLDRLQLPEWPCFLERFPLGFSRAS